MSAAPTQAYLRTKVLTASPAELRLLLLDGAVRFAEQAKAGYEQKNFETAYEGTTKCQAILAELLCSLRPEQIPELHGKLSGLYTFLYRRMVDASAEKSPAIVKEVVDLLKYDRETWVLLMESLKTATAGQTDSNGGASSGGATAHGNGDASGPARSPRLSVSG